MDFVKKKSKGLLIPYISFSFVSMAVYELMVAFLGIEEKLKFPRDLFVVLYGNSQSNLGLVYFAGVEFYLTFQIDVSCGQDSFIKVRI